jgi:hypothetical protein
MRARARRVGAAIGRDEVSRSASARRDGEGQGTQGPRAVNDHERTQGKREATRDSCATSRSLEEIA